MGRVWAGSSSLSTHIANWPAMKSLTDELDGKLCIDVHGYVCIYVCMYILTVCSPLNSMNGSPSLNITCLCKLEMVVILNNMTKADSKIKER